ncbi:MAG TPA: ferredoxin, partial [Candidatus Atribacteria bacterium]|nr:ferredoxin [Candidatus Atribacteria bacterium]
MFHSVLLDEEKCKGCTHCIRRCPTEAIRVKRGKARIDEDRCIDCGECIRTCPNHAKYGQTDSLEL